MISMKGDDNGVSGKWTNKNPFDFDAEFKCKWAVRTWQRFIFPEWLWFDVLTRFEGSRSDTFTDTQRWSTQLTSLHRPGSEGIGLLFIGMTHNRHGGARKHSDVLWLCGFSLLWWGGNGPVVTCWVTPDVESTDERTERVMYYHQTHNPDMTQSTIRPLLPASCRIKC